MTNTSKAPKVTLNSILFAQAPTLAAPEEGKTHSKEVLAQHKADIADHVNTVATNLAQYFVDKTTDTDVISKILVAASKAIPAAVQYQKEEAARAEAAREEARVKAQAERERLNAETEEKAKEEREKMLKLLVAGGVDLAVAQAAVAGVGKKIKASLTGSNNAYNRVTVEVDGKQYDMPEKGNMSQELKDLVASKNMDRETFIETFRVASEDTAA